MASDCSSVPPTGRCERSIGPMLSRPRKPPSNRLLPSASSRLTHQVKLTSSLSKSRLRKSRSRPPIDREHLERGPRLHRRVDVAEVPFVGRERAVRVLEPFPAQQDELVLGEGRVQVGERHAVKAQVPGGEPGVLPLVRHRHDVEGVEVAATGCCGPAAARRRGRLGGIAVQPPGHVEVVELLAPQQAREGLAHHHGLVGAGTGRGQARRRTRRLPPVADPESDRTAPRAGPIVAGLPRPGPQAQPQLGGGARREGQPVPEGAFGALAVRVDRGVRRR